MKKNWFITKLKNKAGESLVEVLIAVLIVAMGMLTLSTLLNVSSRMVDKGQTKVKAVYEDVAEMDKAMAGKAVGKGITIDNKASITVKYSLKNPAAAEVQSKTVHVKLYKGDNLISYDGGGTQ